LYGLPTARSKIRHWINLREREEATEMAAAARERVTFLQQSLEKDSGGGPRKGSRGPRAFQNRRPVCRCRLRKIFRAADSLEVLGEGAKPAETAAEDAKPTIVKTVKRMLGMGEAPLIVKGHDGLLVFRAKCCNPIPGDDITGYITRGRALPCTPNCVRTCRIFFMKRSAAWPRVGRRNRDYLPGSARHSRRDRAGLLAEITAVISGAGSNIRNLESRPDRAQARIDASLEIVTAASLRPFLPISAKSPVYLASTRLSSLRRLALPRRYFCIAENRRWLSYGGLASGPKESQRLLSATPLPQAELCEPGPSDGYRPRHSPLALRFPAYTDS